MDKYRELNFGIVGTGVIAPAHAEGIKDSNGGKLVAVCDLDKDKVIRFAEKYDCPYWYTSYDDMLKREDLDVICVCTPSGLHSEMVVEAASAGKHVICEKPIDITLPAMDKMVQACDDAGVKFGAIFQRRTYASSNMVRDAIQTGKLGRMTFGDAFLRYFRSQEYYDSAGWRGTWELDGGGALMNQGVHGIDLVQWFMGGIEEICAYTGTLTHRIDVEDCAVIALKYKSGALGVLEGTTSACGESETRIEVRGEKGAIVLDDQSIVRWDVEGTSEMITEEEKAGSESSDPAKIAFTGHCIQIQDLIDAIRTDRDPFVTGREAMSAVEVILAVYASARLRRAVRLDELRSL